MEEINENEIKEVLENKEAENNKEIVIQKEEWKSLITRMEEFLYGIRGIITKAYANENLDTYIWNMDEIVDMIKDLIKLQTHQRGFTIEQEKTLMQYKEDFLKIENGKNHIREIYQELKKIYEFSDEY